MQYKNTEKNKQDAKKKIEKSSDGQVLDSEMNL